MEPHELSILVQGPETPSGKRRPRRALLQPVVVMWLRLHRVDRRCYVRIFGYVIIESVTLSFCNCIAYPSGDSNWWAVWLGWHPLEKISRGPDG